MDANACSAGEGAAVQRQTFCVAICTRNRMKLLEDCLSSVLREVVETGGAHSIVVVENDTQPRSERVIAKQKLKFPSVDIAYHLEPELGIATARNRSLSLALSSGADWIAFIDDDEVMQRGWLSAMLRGASMMDAEVLTGPVDYLHELQPVWMPSCGVKNRKRGSRLRTAATNNVAIKTDWLRPHFPVLSFDEDFNFSGGEDSDFFYRVNDLGGRILWVDDARLSEFVPASRLTMKYQLTRTARVAENSFRIHRRRRGYIDAMLRYIPKAIGRLLRGLLLFFFGAALRIFNKPIGSRVWYEGSKALASGAGTLLGLFGMKPNPYKNVMC